MAKNTREMILKAAHQLFIKQGFTATSIRQIAETAVIGKATIYHHFKDKQAIALAWLEEQTTTRTFNFDAVKAESDPRRQIEMVLQISMQQLQNSMDMIQIIRREVPQIRPYLYAKYRTFWQEQITLLTDAILRGQAMGLFREVDPNEVSQMLIALIFGLFNSAVVLENAMPDPEKGTKAMLDIFFKGIEN